MNRERAKELLPIIEAFANGEDIQLQYSDGSWRSDNHMDFSCDLDKYRIKPKPREFWLTDGVNGWIVTNEPTCASSIGYEEIKVREIIE